MAPDRPAINTLRVRREFLAVAKGYKQVRRGLVLQAHPRNASDSEKYSDNSIRLGLTATKKIGNAVIRNRARRRLRALAHEILSAHGQPGYDYVLIGRASTGDRAWESLQTDLRSALKQIHRRKDEKE